MAAQPKDKYLSEVVAQHLMPAAEWVGRLLREFPWGASDPEVVVSRLEIPRNMLRGPAGTAASRPTLVEEQKAP
jgi:hypothetical protein